MNNDILDSSQHFDIKHERLKLIPVWIKIFCWIFLILGIISPLFLLLPFFYDSPINLSILGFAATTPFNLEGLIIISFFVLSGITAYGLLWAKDWGNGIAIFTGILGLLLVFINALINSFNPIPLEPILQIPFTSKMIRIRQRWLKKTLIE